MTQPSNPSTLLEAGHRLSTSLLWQLQRAYFTQQGLAAWRDGTVPSYITSNPYIAKCYAQLVFAWLRDLVADTQHPLDLTQPIYIVELGAGSGQLAYHFLKKFSPLLQSSVLKHLTVRYVMTDFSQATLDTWLSHPQLTPLVNSGQLDFAKFDATQDDSLTLIHSGAILEAGTLKNPLGVIANYVFDGLPQDVFLIKDGQLSESTVTLTSPQPEPDPHDPEILKRLQITYQNSPLSGPAYSEPAFNQILQAYSQSLEHTHLLFPISSLQCLQALRRLANDRLFVIAGDKGLHHESDLDFRQDPTLSVHGSFSMSVNFHALGQYALGAGGQFLATPHRRVSLDVCAFLFGQPSQAYPETHQAYALTVEQGGPDDFYTLKKSVDSNYKEMDIPQLLAYLRLSGWDSNIFVGCFLVILEKVAPAPDALKLDLNEAVSNIWENYYFLGEDKDIPFALGLVLMGIENYSRAVEFFGISLSLHGPDSSTFYYLGLCHYHLRQLDQARTYAKESITLNPQFEPAQTLLAQIQKELP